jgi:acyl-CoA thioester hydrolase
MPVTTPLRVRYAETDQMGIVYYANYLVWFEIGRVELLRSLGHAYSQLEIDHKLILPVVDAHCRYRAPARYDDEILIETWPSLVRESVIRFDYRIYRVANREGEERELLAEGETAHVVCNEKLERQSLPPAYAAALQVLMKKETAKPARQSQRKTKASAKPS